MEDQIDLYPHWAGVISLPHLTVTQSGIMCSVTMMQPWFTINIRADRSADSITCNRENQFSQWQSEPWEPHWFANHLAVNVISSNPLGNPHWSPVLLSDPVLKKNTLSPCSPLQGRLSRSSLWSEKVLNLDASFSIFCFSPHPSQAV